MYSDYINETINRRILLKGVKNIMMKYFDNMKGFFFIIKKTIKMSIIFLFDICWIYKSYFSTVFILCFVELNKLKLFIRLYFLLNITLQFQTNEKYLISIIEAKFLYLKNNFFNIYLN